MRKTQSVASADAAATPAASQLEFRWNRQQFGTRHKEDLGLRFGLDVRVIHSLSLLHTFAATASRLRTTRLLLPS